MKKYYKLKKDFPGSKIGDVWVKVDGFMSPEDSPLRMYYQLFEPFDEWFEEEPKGKALYWMILTLENFIENEPDDKWMDLEDCKQMLEKLKAWQRLEENSWKPIQYDIATREASVIFSTGYTITEQDSKDLDLLFSVEEG